MADQPDIGGGEQDTGDGAVRDEDRLAPADLTTPHVCEGGNLDCGSGLLLLIRKAMDPVPPGEVLNIRSTEISVKEDLPAWCRMTDNPYLGWRAGEGTNEYLVRRGGDPQADAARAEEDYARAREHRWQTRVRWREGLTAEVFCRNHSWEVGQPASFDVEDEAPSAVEHVLGALGACLAMGFQIRASQRGLQVDELEISLAGEIDDIFVFLGVEDEQKEDGHAGFRRISGTLYVASDEDDDALEALWREVLDASPVTQTLLRGLGAGAGDSSPEVADPRLEIALRVL